jgi:hypothetical protein
VQVPEQLLEESSLDELLLPVVPVKPTGANTLDVFSLPHLLHFI